MADNELEVVNNVTEVTNDVVAADDALIDQAVQHINEIANKSVYSGFMEIGQYVLEKFFNNDIKEATSKNPRKPASYQKLCNRDDLAVEVSSLSTAVRVVAQEKFFEEKNINTEKLTYTHKADLVKLANGKEKTELAKACMKNNWSTRKLRDEIKKKLQNTEQKQVAGRDNIPYLKSISNKMDKTNLVTDSEILAKMQKEKREELKKLAAETLAKMQEKIKDCEDLLNKIQEIEKGDTAKSENPN